MVALSPLKLDYGAAAIIFDNLARCRLKDGRPIQIDARAIVPHIHDALLDKTGFGILADSSEDFTAIGEQRLPTLFGGLQTTEPELPWELMRIGVLVMERDGLVRWIFRRRVDLAANRGARSRTLLVREQ